MTANTDTAAQLRYIATVRRQSAPPRCNPFLIVLHVLAGGMIFIGATMTLIAHWPGSSSIGENPLKIAGPVLLAVGFVALIVGIFLHCIINNRERRRWQKKMNAVIVASRSNADLVDMNDESQVKGNVAPATSGKGVQPYSVTAQQHPSVQPQYGFHDDSAPQIVTDGDNVPMPVRVTKPRRPKDTSGEGDITMSSTEDLTAASEAPTDKNVVAPKKRRRPKQPAAGEEESEALMSGDPNARPATDSTPPVQPSPGEARRLKVHIKAQPGASVRIQNAPPAVAPKPAYRSKPHNTSTETDI